MPDLRPRSPPRAQAIFNRPEYGNRSWPPPDSLAHAAGRDVGGMGFIGAELSELTVVRVKMTKCAEAFA